MGLRDCGAQELRGGRTSIHLQDLSPLSETLHNIHFDHNPGHALTLPRLELLPGGKGPTLAVCWSRGIRRA